MQIRPPSIDRGVISFLWAFGLGLFLWLGMMSVGVSAGIAFIISVIAGGAIFLYVRIYGEPERPGRA
jgi:hypothetical protein